MSKAKGSVDLLNVDYDDVLQLYRGWRRSEGLLKDKDKELAAMHARVEQLQASHNRFRSQIQALEGVKELTITLQSNCAVLYQENLSLSSENKSLGLQLDEARTELAARQQAADIQAKALHDSEMELAMFRGRFEQLSNSHMELEKIASEEQASRLATEARMASMEEVTTGVRMENKRLSKELDLANLRMGQCDHELEQASEQLGRLAREVAYVTAKNEQFANLESENSLLKGDIARVLRLLEYLSPKEDREARSFLGAWKDSDGLSFIGLPKSKGAGISGASASAGNTTRRAANTTMVDDDVNFPEPPPFSDDIDEDGISSLPLPEEIDALRDQHGKDPYPLTSSLRDESESWVPRDAALNGLSFFAARLPNTPQHILHDFLRSMNKVWQKREKRKMQRIREAYITQIQDLRRQIQHAKPYRGVIAEKKIRMLKSQVDKERGKRFKGKPSFRDAEEDRVEDVVEINDAPREQLLHASLSTLETMGRHIKQSAMDHSYRATGKTGVFPSEHYLQGAMWLGRNFVMISEEMSEALEFFRTKVLREISSVTEDRSDLVRCVNRLSLIAGSTVTEAVEITSRYKIRAREILRGASSIRAGDHQAMSLFLRNLPIDSILEKSNLTTSYGAVEPRFRSASVPVRRTTAPASASKHRESASPRRLPQHEHSIAKASSPGVAMSKTVFVSNEHTK